MPKGYITVYIYRRVISGCIYLLKDYTMVYLSTQALHHYFTISLLTEGLSQIIDKPVGKQH